MFSSADMFATGRCRYPSKFCPNARAHKRNGELHRFCEEHRAKANDNQKRWSSTRQRQWDVMEYQIAMGSASAHGVSVDSTAAQTNKYPYTYPLAETVPNGRPTPSQGLPSVAFVHVAPRPFVTAGNPQTSNQAEEYLTHLLYRVESSSDVEEHLGAVTSRAGHSHI